MKTKFICLTAFVIFAVAISSCKKDGFRRDTTGSDFLEAQEKNEYQVQFSRTLAKAVKKESGLRTFIRTEALKKFDHDYDVLFQMVKDIKVDGNSTFYEVLTRYADDKQLFEDACNKLPLLTIFVPTTPSFSPQTWNPESEIPVIAVEPDRKINAGKVSLFNEAGKYLELSTREVPGFPVVVIKNNERVILSTTKEWKPDHIVKESIGKIFFANENFSYRFRDNVFDNITIINKNNVARTGIYDPLSGSPTIDKVNVDAYNSGSEWHRDFVYYGIAPGTPNGEIDLRFREFITSFKFINGNDLMDVSDQADDPTPDHDLLFTDPSNEVLWTEGNFEFRVSIFINAKNGLGQELRKNFSAQGSDLFNLQYEKRELALPGFYCWVLIGASPIPYNPNIEIVPWDLDAYGSAWKFVTIEFDPVEEHTQTVTHTTTFAGNFEINLATGNKWKVGAKFGGSATTQSSSSYQYKYTTGNDELADGVLDFRYSIITSLSPSGQGQAYSTYEVTSGKISMSVEPKRVY